MNIVEEVKEVISKLNAIDSYNSSLPQQLSIIDKKQQDILHLIESQKISAFEAYRIIKELRQVRIERRKIKNDMELLRVYDENKNKLSSNENRQFLLHEVCKKEKNLNTEYKYQEYTKEELESIIK